MSSAQRAARTPARSTRQTRGQPRQRPIARKEVASQRHQPRQARQQPLSASEEHAYLCAWLRSRINPATMAPYRWQSETALLANAAEETLARRLLGKAQALGLDIFTPPQGRVA